MYNQGMVSSDGRPPPENCRAWKFYYDGDCGLCRRLVRGLSRLDFGRAITWISFQSLERPPQSLSWSDLDRAAFLELDTGDLLEGFYAFRMLTLKVPSLWPLAPLFWLPGVHVPGRAIYRWVAANRYRLSRCTVPDGRPGPDGSPPPGGDG
jgi:predicted DCC family thiol-disulfide oxidoreductase YuxK